MDAVVEVPHRTVVVAARVLQVILELNEVLVQLAEVPVGFELGILLGQSEEA